MFLTKFNCILSNNVAVEEAPAREARRVPNSDAVRAAPLEPRVQVSRYAADQFHLFNNPVVAWRALPPVAITMASSVLCSFYCRAFQRGFNNVLAFIRGLDSTLTLAGSCASIMRITAGPGPTSMETPAHAYLLAPTTTICGSRFGMNNLHGASILFSSKQSPLKEQRPCQSWLATFNNGLSATSEVVSILIG